MGTTANTADLDRIAGYISLNYKGSGKFSAAYKGVYHTICERRFVNGTGASYEVEINGATYDAKSMCDALRLIASLRAPGA